MRLLTITLNLLFLFIFGAGQICFCTESDKCQGVASFFADSDSIAIGTVSKEPQVKCASAGNQDCCVDCFNSIDIAAGAGNSIDSTSFEVAGPVPSWTPFAIAQNENVERPRVRAPPNGFGRTGTKTYLAKQSLLI